MSSASDTSASPPPQPFAHVATNIRRPKHWLTWHRLASIVAMLLGLVRMVLGAKNLTLGSNIADGILGIPVALWVMVGGWLESDPPSCLTGYLDTDWRPYTEFAGSFLRRGKTMIDAIFHEILHKDYAGLLAFAYACVLNAIQAPTRSPASDPHHECFSAQVIPDWVVFDAFPVLFAIAAFGNVLASPNRRRWNSILMVVMALLAVPLG